MPIGPGRQKVEIADSSGSTVGVVGNPLVVDVGASPVPVGAATATLQVVGNASLSSIDGKIDGLATAANQTTQITSLSSIDGKLLSDAFGWLRISERYTVFDSKQLFDKQPLVWDDVQFSGAGTSSTYNANQASTTLAVSASTAGVRVRQTFRWPNYQPGKSQLIFMTSVLGAPAAGITREVGQFNAQNGVFFRSGPTGVSVVLRSFVTGVAVDTVVPQASWNLSTAPGTDWSKTQGLVFDYEWLGVGSVRCGIFSTTGQLQYVHRFDNSNVLTTVWASTPNLPLRYRIANDGTGVAASLTHICTTIISEGGVQDPGLSLASARTTVFTTLNNASIWPVQGLRLKSTYLGITVLPRNISIVCASNALFAYYLIVNPTIAGAAPVWAGITNSAVETATATTNANTATGGTILAAGVVQQTNEASVFVPSPTGFVLGSNIAGTPQELWLCVQKLVGGAEDFYSAMSWGEL